MKKLGSDLENPGRRFWAPRNTPLILNSGSTDLPPVRDVLERASETIGVDIAQKVIASAGDVTMEELLADLADRQAQLEGEAKAAMETNRRTVIGMLGSLFAAPLMRAPQIAVAGKILESGKVLKPLEIAAATEGLDWVDARGKASALLKAVKSAGSVEDAALQAARDSFTGILHRYEVVSQRLTRFGKYSSDQVPNMQEAMKLVVDKAGGGRSVPLHSNGKVDVDKFLETWIRGSERDAATDYAIKFGRRIPGLDIDHERVRGSLKDGAELSERELLEDRTIDDLLSDADVIVKYSEKKQAFKIEIDLDRLRKALGLKKKDEDLYNKLLAAAKLKLEVIRDKMIVIAKDGVTTGISASVTRVIDPESGNFDKTQRMRAKMRFEHAENDWILKATANPYAGGKAKHYPPKEKPIEAESQPTQAENPKKAKTIKTKPKVATTLNDGSKPSTKKKKSTKFKHPQKSAAQLKAEKIAYIGTSKFA